MVARPPLPSGNGPSGPERRRGAQAPPHDRPTWPELLCAAPLIPLPWGRIDLYGCTSDGFRTRSSTTREVEGVRWKPS